MKGLKVNFGNTNIMIIRGITEHGLSENCIYVWDLQLYDICKVD